MKIRWRKKDEEDEDEDEDEDDYDSEEDERPKPKLVLSNDTIELNDMNTTSVDDYIENMRREVVSDNNEETNKIIEEPLDKSDNKVENNLEIQEVDINLAETPKDDIKLKSHDEVYYELYQAARTKAKLARKAAIEAYLEVRNIKNLYMLDEIDSDDDDEFKEIFENSINSSSLA